MLIDWLHDFRNGARQLARRPAFALVAVASLALGIGACTLLFGAVNMLLLQPVPGVSDPARLLEIGRGSHGDRFDTFAKPDLDDIEKSVPAFESVFSYHMAPLNVRTSGDPRRALGFVVSESYFETLGVKPALGRTFVASDAGKLESDPVVVVSDAAWHRAYAADPGVIGRKVTLNGATFTIIGVAPPSFHGHVAVLQPEFFVPLSASPLINAQARALLTQRASRWLLGGARLKAGATIEQARTQLDALAARLGAQFPESHKDVRFDAAPLAALPAAARMVLTVFASVMFALVGLILVLACVNVAGMLLARGEARSGEMALRAALGASRARIVRQLFAEGLVLACVAGVAGVALAFWSRGLLRLIPIPAPFPVELALPMDMRVMAFAALASVATAVVFGAWPALRLSQRDPRTALGAGGSTGTLARTRSRDALVVAQIAVSLLLLVAAGLFLRSLGRAAAIDPGFRADGVAYAELDLQPAGYSDEKSEAIAEQFLARVRALPGIESAALGSMLPLSMGRLGFGEARDPSAPDRRLDADVNTVSDDYFKTLGIPLKGRDFARTDTFGGDGVVVVNETFAKQMFGGTDVIGRTFDLGDDREWHKLAVVGVTPDGKYASLDEHDTGFLFLPNAQWRRQSLNVLVKAAMPPVELEQLLRRELAIVDPNLPAPSAHALTDVTAISVMPQRIAGYVASVLGFVGLLLAATGLYGVMAFYVVQRQREIGVRLALGATRRAVVGAVARRAARLAGLGLAIGIVLAALTSQALASLLFGVTAGDLWAFLGAAALLAIAAALATLGPAWRAVSIEPSRALRYE